MPVTEKNKSVIWGQFAGRCAICRLSLIEKTASNNQFVLLGEVAHIIGEKLSNRKSARSHSNLSKGERNLPENLLLLCRPHHKLIDEDENTYPVEHLLEIRRKHFEWLGELVPQPSPWTFDLDLINYLNLPRLANLAISGGHKIDLTRFGDFPSLHSLGWKLVDLMNQFKTVLGRLFIKAVEIEEIEGPFPQFIGTLCSFNRSFRTKNIPFLQRDQEDMTLFTGDLSKDPHIYCRINGFKLVMNIQPKYVTTTTAFVLFSPSGGHSFFKGLCAISNVDYQNKIVTAIPLVIGLPQSPVAKAFQEFVSGSGKIEADEIESLEGLVDLAKALEVDKTFCEPPEACDLCGLMFDSQSFFVDGALKQSSLWAFMCEDCYQEKGKGICWGSGQLYMRVESNNWLLVSGFRPEDPMDEFY